MPDVIRQAILDWYVFLSSLSAQVTTRTQTLDQIVRIPLVTAVLLGLTGAAAPCQLTTSVGALTVLGRSNAGRPRWRGVLAYLAGKSLVYTALGLLAVAVGASLSQVSIPVFVATRKALGPLMVVVGLALVGVLRLHWAPGHAIVSRLRGAARPRADGAPFLLGVAFGFSFCPTLFTLFFGLLIPLALSRPDGLLYPALFALGTALPLLLALGLLALGGGSLRRSTGRIGRAQRVLAPLGGLLLVLAGLHDTLIYWLL